METTTRLPNGEDVTPEWGVGYRNDPDYPLRECVHCGRKLGEDVSGKWRHIDYGTLSCPSDAGSLTTELLACIALSIIPVTLAVIFLAKMAGMVTGV